MHAALVVMAAGLGSRYGGMKQVEQVGPAGEILMEYAIYDAMRAGFDRVVLIVKPEMLEDVREHFGERVSRASGLEFCYAIQYMDGEWEGIPIPTNRSRPLGTVHALLSAERYLDRPFAALNADDYYGPGAIAAIGAALPKLRGAADSAMVAYRLRNTVSPYGTVTRGVCAVRDRCLEKVTETFKILPFPDGTIRDTSEDAAGKLLDPDAPVSMNLWGFHPEIMKWMRAYFQSFLQGLGPEDGGRECLLPVFMDELVCSGRGRCRVLHTDDRWFGLTYPQDKAGVVEALRTLHNRGAYPPALFGAQASCA